MQDWHRAVCEHHELSPLLLPLACLPPPPPLASSIPAANSPQSAADGRAPSGRQGCQAAAGPFRG